MAYVASKHGLIGMTKSLAVDWAKDNIRVNSIAPGFIAGRGAPAAKSDGDRLRHESDPHATLGNDRELGLAVLYLASPASSYVTGATSPLTAGGCPVGGPRRGDHASSKGPRTSEGGGHRERVDAKSRCRSVCRWN